jgi:transposase
MTKWDASWGHANLPSGACPAWKAGSEADRRDAQEGAGVGAGAAAGADLASTRPGRTATQVAGNVGVAPKTVRAIARRYEAEGLEPALYEKPRPGQPRVLDAGQSQRIIAMVCSQPPEGQARWSVRLIAQEAVKRKLVRQVGRETIRILLRDHDLKPWREKNVVRGRTGPGIHRPHGRRAGRV